MEAEILAWGEFISIATICLSFVVVPACVLIIYKKWGEYYEMDNIFFTFGVAVIVILCAIMASLDLYKIRNYPQAYMADKMKSSQCK